MISLVLRRIGFAGAVMAGTGVVVACLLSVVPDSATALGPGERFLRNLETLLTFDYGRSREANFPISALLWDRGLNSLLLIAGALAVLGGVGVPLGLGRALRPESWLVQSAAGAAHMLSSIPILVWSFALLIVSGSLFGVYPDFSNLASASTGEALLTYSVPIIALALGDGMLSDVIRNVRGEIEQEWRQTYTRALQVRRVPVLHHLAWGVSAAVFNALSNKMTYLISGTIIVEYVFGVRGLAYQIYASITGVKDYPLVLASTMLFVAIIVAVNLLGEFIAIIADPRLRAA